MYIRLIARSTMQKGVNIDRLVGPFRDSAHFRAWFIENGLEVGGKPEVYGAKGHSKVRINLGPNASKELSGMVVWAIIEEPLAPNDVLVVPES